MITGLLVPNLKGKLFLLLHFKHSLAPLHEIYAWHRGLRKDIIRLFHCFGAFTK